MQKETTTGDIKPILSGLWLVTAIAIQAYVFGMMARTIPQFAKMFQDMMPGEPLPSVTMALLRIKPAWCVVVMTIMILALVAKEMLILRRRVRAWISIGFAAAAGLVFLIYIVAMFRPLVGCTGGLGR